MDIDAVDHLQKLSLQNDGLVTMGVTLVSNNG